MTPSYWQGALALADAAALTGGSVASRGQRSEKRKLASSLGDLGVGSGKRRKRGSCGDLQDLQDESALALNELGFRKKKVPSRKPHASLRMHHLPRSPAISCDLPRPPAFCRDAQLIFGKSAIHSWGLYAAEPIEKEDFVVEYLGE